MKPNEINKAIAEYCGFKIERKGLEYSLIAPNGSKGFSGTKDRTGHCYPAISENICWKHGPDYFNDLNAMHEAEKKLGIQDAPNYQSILIKVTVKLEKLFPEGSAYPMDGFLIHATSQQRAEAFVKTIGKWTK